MNNPYPNPYHSNFEHLSIVIEGICDQAEGEFDWTPGELFAQFEVECGEVTAVCQIDVSNLRDRPRLSIYFGYADTSGMEPMRAVGDECKETFGKLFQCESITQAEAEFHVAFERIKAEFTLKTQN